MATLATSTSGADELHRIGGAEDGLGVDAGVLTIEGCSTTDLVREYGSPLYVISESTLRRNYRRIRDAFNVRWPTDFTVYYAVKANNNFAVRAILFEEGAGGDCFGPVAVLGAGSGHGARGPVRAQRARRAAVGPRCAPARAHGA